MCTLSTAGVCNYFVIFVRIKNLDRIKNPFSFVGLPWAISRRNMKNCDFSSSAKCDKTADIDKSL